MNIKFVDLKKNVESLKPQLSDKITEFLFNDCYYINGEQVKEFENNFDNDIISEAIHFSKIIKTKIKTKKNLKQKKTCQYENTIKI